MDDNFKPLNIPKMSGFDPLANFGVFDTEIYFSGDFFPPIEMLFFVSCNC